MGKSTEVERGQSPKSWRENWRRDCQSFKRWANSNNGNFMEVLMAVWCFAMAIVLGSLVGTNEYPEGQELWLWIVVSVLLLVTAALLVHMMWAWARWERQAAQRGAGYGAESSCTDEPTIRFRWDDQSAEK